jgi:F0F1-type ATP synthase assembly protein I
VGSAQGLSFASVPALVIAGAPRDEQASIAAMTQVSYSGMSAVFPVVLFVILAGYVTQATPAGVIYQSAAFTAGSIFTAVMVAVALLLALTVLRVRRDQGMIHEEELAALTPSLESTR